MSSLADVHQKFGEASETAQLLETELGNILLAIEGRESGLFFGDRQEEAAEILRGINKSTLGQLFRKLQARGQRFDSAADLLANAIAERNRLSHSFFRKHNFRKFSPEGRRIMLQDLESIHETLLRAYGVALEIAGTDLDSLQVPVPPIRFMELD